MVQFIELTKKDGKEFSLEIHRIISIEDNMIKNSGADRETTDEILEKIETIQDYEKAVAI